MPVNRRQRGRQSDAVEQSWLLTYSDMVTLLLAFFVLLFTFSNLDAQKYEAVIASLQGSLGVLEGGKSFVPDHTLLEPAGVIDEAAGEITPGTNVLMMYQSLVRFIEEEGLTGTMSVELSEPGIIVRFSDQVLFDLGQADLKPEFESTLTRFATAISTWQGDIRVEGHSDSLPIYRPKFPSNWELSSARASTVVRFLIGQDFDPEKLSVAGYGEHRPIDDNSTLEGRARNRRVDVVLLAESEDAGQAHALGEMDAVE